MANVNSLSSSSSSTSSLYGSRNVLSGLASGLDTETLIENSVSGYKSKITSLQQEQEQITWKQDAFRSITDKMAGMISEFTSYTSKTNLYSESFFTSAISTTALGAYGDKVLATGKSTSDVQINGVSSLATATRFSVQAFDGATNNSSEAIDWTDWGEKTEGKSFTVAFDGAVRTIRFDQLKEKMGDYEAMSDSEKTTALASAMQKVLDERFGAGRITVKSVEDNTKLFFGVNSGASISITSDQEDALGVNGTISNELSDKRLGQLFGEEDGISNWKLTVNGVEIEGISVSSTMQEVLTAINSSDAGVTASFSPLTGQFSFVSKDKGTSSDIVIGGDWGEKLFTSKLSAAAQENKSLFSAMGFGSNTHYITVTASNGQRMDFDDGFGTAPPPTLGDLQNWLGRIGITVEYDAAHGEYSFRSADGSSLEDFTLTTQGDDVFTLQDLFNNPNSTYVKGTDAVVNVTINGQDLTLTRASNTLELDGMEVTLRDTFNMDGDGKVVSKADAVTFKTVSDADKVVAAVKSFVEQYNAVLSELREAVVTRPLERDSSKHTKYMPLTEDDKNSMSETAIKNYEEKAKTGLLYNDSDLKNLYNQMVSLANSSGVTQLTQHMTDEEFTAAVTASGKERIGRESIGISTTYSDGLTQLTLDEDALRAALERDADSVRKVFTNPDSNGENNTGWMESVKTLFNTYASTSVASPGILVQKAGTKLSALSLTNNTLQEKFNALTTKIETWQSKMATKIDFYTKQFTAMEQLISSMNNQSSMLSSLTGYSY